MTAGRPTVALHISHTDVRVDARILREMDAIRGMAGIQVEGIGVESSECRDAGGGSAQSEVKVVRLLSQKLRFLPRPLRYLLNFVELGARVLPSALRVRPAIVHCHDTLVLPVGVAIRAMTGCALIYDAHELESEKNGQSATLARITLWIERCSWKWISLLVSVSPAIIDWYEMNLGPKRSTLVLNSPVLSRTSPSSRMHGTRSRVPAGYFHERFGIALGEPVFVYVGYIVPGRGIERVVDAFLRPGTSAHAVFMGSGDEARVRALLSSAPNIHWHPPVPHDRVVELIRDATCGLCLIEDVSLSDRYCLPNKLFEYAFAGVPVLASRLPEIERMVEDYGLGMCCDNDAGSIANAVKTIMERGLASPSGDLSEISWDRQAMRLRAAYADLLNCASGRASSRETGD